jgi:hypothetical protein
VSELHLDKDEASRISDYLSEAGLIEYVGGGPLVRITVEGIDYVEDALLKARRAHRALPPDLDSHRASYSALADPAWNSGELTDRQHPVRRR